MYNVHYVHCRRPKKAQDAQMMITLIMLMAMMRYTSEATEKDGHMDGKSFMIHISHHIRIMMWQCLADPGEGLFTR